MSRDQVAPQPPRIFQPFGEPIVQVEIPHEFRNSVIDAFDGTQDPMRHVAAFRTQMIISGGTDAMWCKMFAGTLKDTALEWFTNLPDRSIRDFPNFSAKFVTQFSANKKKRVEGVDLFDIKQKQDKSLKEYLARFTAAMVQVDRQDPYYVCSAFQKGLRAGPLRESLFKKKPLNMDDVRVRAECHIEAEEANAQKRREEMRETIEFHRPGGQRGRRQRNQLERQEAPRPAPPARPPTKRSWEDFQEYTALNTSRGQILREVYSTRLLQPPLNSPPMMGLER